MFECVCPLQNNCRCLRLISCAVNYCTIKMLQIASLETAIGHNTHLKQGYVAKYISYVYVNKCDVYVYILSINLKTKHLHSKQLHNFSNHFSLI